ncbi:MAG TPA: transposase [Candidatus Limnocylindrales bacterium]|nr:transposase [Candidatus Limnocylindrales bacterium]
MQPSGRQWELIEQFFPDPKRRRDGRGGPWAFTRDCIERILWVLKAGARWRDLPPGTV